MSSSLASQLAQVRSLNAERLSGAKAASNVQSTSYLFPPSVAATQDLDTIHGIAVNGWEELCNGDSAFESWDESTGSARLLFGEGSKGLDRLTKTKEDNAVIDEAISDFLLLVGDSLLDRSAGKCIEWLVRRFRAHEHNVDAILAAFIPFHETAEFARMLQIVNLKNKPQFSFLAPVQKQSIPLPTSVLLSTLLEPPQTTNSTVVLRWIASLPLDDRPESRQHRRPRHTACSFWLSTIVKLCSLWSGSGDLFIRMGLTKSLGKRKQVREDDAQSLLSILLPAVLRLAHSTEVIRDAPSYSSMALCAIANAFELSTQAAKGVIDSIAATPVQGRRSRAALLTACACILSHQLGEEEEGRERILTPETAHRLAAMLGDGAIIANLTSTSDWSAFARHMGLALASDSGELSETATSHNALLWVAGEKSGITDSALSDILRSLLAGWREDTSDSMVEMLSTMRQSRSQVWEQVLASVMRESSEQSRRNLEQMMSRMIARQAGLTVADAGTTKWLSIYGAESTGRLSAWRSIVKAVETGSLDARESIVKDTLTMIMTEGNAENLAEMYQTPDLIARIAGVQTLIKLLQQQLDPATSAANQQSEAVVSHHLRFLLGALIANSIADAEQQMTLFSSIIWPRLLISKSDMDATKAFYRLIAEIFAGRKAKKLTRVQDILAGIATEEDLQMKSEGNSVVAAQIGKQVAKDGELVVLLEAALDNGSQYNSVTRARLMAILVTTQALKTSSEPRLIALALNGIKAITGNNLSSLSSTAYGDVVKEAGEAAYSKPHSMKASALALIRLLVALVEHCPADQTSTLGNANTAAETAITIFSTVTSFASSAPALAKGILSALAKRLGNASITVFAGIWSACDENGHLYQSSSSRLLALSYAQAYFTGKEGKKHESIDFQTLVPSLLVALSDPEKRIRVQALGVVEVLLRLSTKATKGEAESQSVQVFGYDTLYGPVTAEGLTYLETSEVTHFLHLLHEARSSFVNDAEHVGSWMQGVLGVAKGESRKLASRKNAVVHWLSTHVLCWNNIRARLTLLAGLVNIGFVVRLQSLLPLLKQCIEAGEPGQSAATESLIGSLFLLYDKSARDAIEIDEGSCWTTFKHALESGSEIVQRQAAKALREKTFRILSPEKQSDVITLLANLVANSDRAVLPEIRKCLSTLHIDASILVPILINIRETVSSQLSATPKKKRSRMSIDEPQGASSSIPVLLELLENIMSQRHLASSALATELFEILRLGTELFLSGLPIAEQLLQVTMSDIQVVMASSTTKAMSDDGAAVAASEVFEPMKVETLVNIVKLPCKPQTFQQALLLLSLVSQAYPDLVLQHSMSIFSFVGSTVLQRDDEHSFNVIEKTLTSILPPVVQSIRRSAAASSSTLSFMQASRALLCIFTDAAMHIPRHRRQIFFHLLADVMGASHFTAPLCMLLVDGQAYKAAKLSHKEEIARALQLPLSLIRQSEDDVDVLLDTLGETLEEIVRTWQHRSEDHTAMQEHVFLDCLRDIDSEHAGRKMDPVKRILALLYFVRLTVEQGRDAIEDGRVDESDEEAERRDGILQAIVHHGLALTRCENEAIAEAAQDALDEVMTVVSVSTLEHVTSSLLGRKDEMSQRNGLQIASTSLGSMMESERRQATTFTPQVIVKAVGILASKRVAGKELQISALDALCAVLTQPQASEHSALADGVLTIADMARSSTDKDVVDRALEVVRRSCEILGPRLIPMLASLIKICQQIVSEDEAGRQSGGALDILSALVRSVPSFVSTHLTDILGMCVKQRSLSESGSMRKMLSAVSRHISPNDVQQSIAEVHTNGDKGDVHLHLFCLDVLQLCIRSMDKQKTLSQHKQIFRFLVTFFDVRRQSLVSKRGWSLTGEEIQDVESKSVGVFIRLVFRLSEAVFRPLFLRLCDWAQLDLADGGDEAEAEQQGQKEQVRARQVVLYKVLTALLQELGELVTHYYTNVLDSTIETLSRLAEEQTQDATLWSPIVNSIKLCTTADSSGFWNAARANKLLPVLVQQVQTPVVERSTAMQHLLSDTVCALCKDVADESCVKKANDGLLALTRETGSDGDQTRLIALHSLQRLWKTKGCEDSLLTLVPETVPSIAELLQEGDEVLQPAVMALVGAIEEILGEGLESYLQ